MREKAQSFCHVIDVINEYTGRVVSLLFIPLVLITVITVTSRYLFNAPMIWAWDVNIQLAGALAFLAAGYTLLHRGHVVLDLLVKRLSPRARARIDLVISLVFLLVIGILLWVGAKEAWHSVVTREAYTSIWEPPIYHLRVGVAIGVFLLLSQGIAKFIRDLIIVTRTGKERVL